MGRTYIVGKAEMAIRAVAFDWGNTLMRVFPGQRGVMATWPEVEAMPGVVDAVPVVAARYVCCVASNAGRSEAGQVATALARIGLAEHFTHIFTAADLGRAKPDPRFFGAILATLGIEPHECVMVGDDYFADVVGAKAVGMRAIWVARGSVAGLPPEADAVISSLAELPASLQRLDTSSP